MLSAGSILVSRRPRSSRKVRKKISTSELQDLAAAARNPSCFESLAASNAYQALSRSADGFEDASGRIGRDAAGKAAAWSPPRPPRARRPNDASGGPLVSSSLRLAGSSEAVNVPLPWHPPGAGGARGGAVQQLMAFNLKFYAPDAYIRSH